LVTNDGEIISASDIEDKLGDQIKAGTLIRKIEKNHFDVDATHWQKKLAIKANSDEGLRFTCRLRDLPNPVPSS
ncbi:beta-ketoacyl synthase, partial [Pseudoalteromonas ruthenica]